MDWSTASWREYAATTIVAVLTLAAFQYVGLGSDGSGTVDWVFLGQFTVVFPVCIFVVKTLTTNLVGPN